MSQSAWNIILWLWTSLHDFVYMGIAWLLVHLHIIRPSKALEDRLKALEEKHGIN